MPLKIGFLKNKITKNVNSKTKNGVLKMIKTSLKDLRNIVKDVNLEIKAVDKRNVDRVNLLNAKVALLKEISAYVKSYEWLIQKDYKSMIMDFCNCKLDYSILKTKYKLSDDCAKSTVAYANERLRKRIGADTLDLINRGEIETAKKRFYVCSNKADIKDCLLKDVYDLLPNPAFNPIDLNSQEAQQAFHFIKTYSRTEMQRRFSTIDKEALKYVLYVVTGQSTKQVDKFEEYIDALFETDNN